MSYSAQFNKTLESTSLYDNVDDDDFEDKDYKDLILFLIDCSPLMFTSNTIESALKCASTTLRNKIIASPDDLVGVMLYNTSFSDTLKTTVQAPKNYHLLTPIDEPNVKMIKDLESFKPKITESTTTKAGLTHPFSKSLNILSSKRYQNYSKRIFIFTTEDDPHSSSIEEDRSSKLVLRDLNHLGVELELFPLKDEFDFDLYWADACQLMNSPIQKDDNGDGDGSSYEDKLEILLQRVQKKEKKKRVLGRLHFHLLPSSETNRITFSCNLYSFITSAGNTAPPVWVTKEELECGAINRSSIYGYKESTSATESTSAISTTATLTYSLDFGGKVVKFDEEGWMEKMVLLSNQKEGEGERMMQLISMHKRQPTIAELWGMGVGRHSYFLRPDDSDLLKSSTTFECLRKSMLEEDVCALVYFKVRIKSPLQLGLLIPSEVDEDATGFHLIIIPFLEDIRPSVSLDCMDDCISDYDNAAADGDDDAVDEKEETPKRYLLLKKAIERLKLPDGFVIEDYDNPTLVSHYQSLEEVAMSSNYDDNDSPLPPPPLPPSPSHHSLKDSTIPNVKAMHRRAGEHFKQYLQTLSEEPSAKRKNNK